MRMFLLYLVLTCVFAACGGSERVATPPRVTSIGPIYRAAAPTGETGTFVAVHFALADAEDNQADLTVEFSRNGGAFVAIGDAGAGEVAPGSDGIRGLTARIEGSSHRLLWKAPADLGDSDTVRVRLTPYEPEVIEGRDSVGAQNGSPATSPAFTLGGLAPEPT